VANDNNYPSIEQLERAKELLELKKENAALSDKETQDSLDLIDQYGTLEAALRRIKKDRIEANAAEREELDTLKEQADQLRHIAASGRDRKELAQLQLEIAQKEYDLKQKTKGVSDEDLRVARERVETADDLNRELEKTAAAAGKIEATFKRAFSMKESADFIGAMERVGVALGEAASIGGIFNEVLTGIGTAGINNVAGLALKLYDAENTFRKATGASEAFASSLTDVYKSTRQTGATIADVSAAMESLYVNYTDFTMQTKATREEIADVGTTLGMLGVKQDSFGKGMQNATKMFGIAGTEASATMLEITAHAKDLGLAPSQMASEFAAAGGQLAKFGDQGVKAFKDLQTTAKITGMEMNKILQLTNKFDTFESAAGMAGKLNAALGGNFVNAMDMMMETDPKARFEMIRDSITNAGLSFDTMSYYQRQFYTESLGLNDVGELAMMLSGKMDGLTGDIGKTSQQLIDMKEQAAAVQDMQTQLNALLAEATVILEPLVKSIRNVVSVLVKYKKIVIPFIQVSMAWAAAQKLLIPILKTIIVLRNLGIIGTMKETIQKIFNAKATDRQTQAEQRQIMTKKSLSKVSVSAALNMLAFGAAIMLVGAGIGLATTGIGNMAEGISMLNTEQLSGFTSALIGLAVALGVMIIAFAVMAANPASQMGLLFLLAIGGALLMIGGGIYLATTGIGKMAEGFGKLKGSGIGEIATKMKELASVAADFTTVANEFERVAAAIKSIPETKAVAVAMTMTAAASAAMGAASPARISNQIEDGANKLNLNTGQTNAGNQNNKQAISIKLDAGETRKFLNGDAITPRDIQVALSQGRTR
jgi:hypothetical protein